jgi:hypothetical protein
VKNPCLDIALAELESAGVRDIQIARGSKHPQVRFRINGGPVQVFSVPGTPGDWRSPQNTRADIKKFLRECGVPEPERSRKQPLKKPDRITLLERRVDALEHQLTKLLKDKSDDR